MKLSFSHYQTSHLVALAAASFVHIGIAAWSMMPSNPVVINQQVIQVSFVAPNSAERKNSTTEKQKITLNEKQNAFKQKQNDKGQKLAEAEKKICSRQKNFWPRRSKCPCHKSRRN